jgi:lipopolysaccharide export system protein LptC
MHAMAVELHLPDLPEVPLALGPVRRVPPRPRRCPGTCGCARLLATYLPLLLMALLALGTWWLVKNTPRPPPARERRPAQRARLHDVGFVLQRFDADGPPGVRIEGRAAAALPGHRPHRDRRARVRAIAPDGRVTLARAPRRWPTATAARCSCSAARVDSATTRACRWWCAASSCTLHRDTERCARTCRCRCSTAGAEFAPPAGLRPRSRHARAAGPMRALLPRPAMRPVTPPERAASARAAQ